MSDADFSRTDLLEYRAFQRIHAETFYTRLVEATAKESSIDFYARVKVDDYLTVTLGEWGGYLIQVMPMIFSNRLVMTPIRTAMFYDYGWCFPKGPAVAMAAFVWNPQSQAEPVGFIKRIGGMRLPGERAHGALPNG